MKFHWGQCPAELIMKEHLECKEDQINYNAEQQKLYKEVVLTLDAEKKYSAQLLQQNDELAAKIKHLEEVISDYNKITLMAEQPVYIEAATLPESKQKRARKSL